MGCGASGQQQQQLREARALLEAERRAAEELRAQLRQRQAEEEAAGRRTPGGTQGSVEKEERLRDVQERLQQERLAVATLAGQCNELEKRLGLKNEELAKALESISKLEAVQKAVSSGKALAAAERKEGSAPAERKAKARNEDAKAPDIKKASDAKLKGGGQIGRGAPTEPKAKNMDDLATSTANVKDRGEFARKTVTKARAGITSGTATLRVERSNLIIDYPDPERLKEHYQVSGDKLGQGAFGTVTRATHICTGEVRAMKSVPKAKLKALREEIRLMKRMDHPNVIRLFETFTDDTHVYLAMEICDGGELFDLIVARDALSEAEAAVVMQQLLRAVHHMHSRRVVHRDLKPENLMLQGKGSILGNVLKVIDLGLASEYEPGVPLTAKCGTPVYMAPEQVAGSYDHMVDIWACGCIMYNLLSGCLPIDATEDAVVYQMVKEGLYTMPPEYWGAISKEAQELVRWMMTYVPRARCTAELALTHAWISETAPRCGHMPLPAKVLSNMRCHRQKNALKQAALQVVACHLRDEQLAELRNLFLSLDKNNNGMLSIEELEAGLRATDPNGKEEEWAMILSGLIPEDGGEISYTEFLAAAMDRTQYLQRNVILAAFKIFDRDGSGKISPAELRAVLAAPPPNAVEGGAANRSPKPGRGSLGLATSCITELLLEVDKSGDGEIDLEEFTEMMHQVGNNLRLA